MSEFTAEVRALTIEFGQNLFSFFREIFQTPSSQLTDKLATVYSLALTGDDSGDFSTDAFANNNMFDAINTLVTNTPYLGLKSTIPKIKSLLDGYGEQHLGFEEALRDVRTEKDIQLADTFKNKITAKFINSIVSGSGIQDMDIDVFGSDESGLRSAYNNMLSYITTQVDTKMATIPETAMSNKTSNLYSKFAEDSGNFFKTFLNTEAFQRIYSAYEGVVKTGEVSESVITDLFDETSGAFPTMLTQVSTALATINDDILTYVQSDVVDDAVDAFETKQETKLTADLAKVKARMASQNALNESSNALTEVMLRRDIESSVADFRSNLQLKLFDAFHQYSIQREGIRAQTYANKYQQDISTKAGAMLQLISNMFQSINQGVANNFSYLNQRIESYTDKDNRLTEMLGQNINAYNLQKVATELQFRSGISNNILQTIQADKAFKQQDIQLISTLNKELYLADFDNFRYNTDFTLKDSFLKIDALMHGFNAMASVNGQVTNLNRPNPMSSMVAGAISGGVTGASIGQPVLGAIAGGIGSLIGGIK